MKIAVAGKGGVGKTTIAATLARLLGRDSYRVLAIDADPAMNFASALGYDHNQVTRITPLSENADLVEERTGARPGTSGSVFSITPRVDDLLDKYGIQGPDGITLMIMGTIRSAGGGCMCPANSLLKALIRHLLIERGDVVIMDMEAGLEHLGRGTVKGVDVLLDIVEPSTQSIDTARRIKELSRHIGVKNVVAVGNKVRNLEEEEFLKRSVVDADLEMIQIIPYDAEIAKADRMRKAAVDYAPSSSVIQTVKKLETYLIEKLD